ncbi:hypothetical protein K456DRAFT_481657 [Colletotrichum gloeosporioides 23]|nr:hypothetical protein K456DRAFT_481657 [Colletotrichum gloeosporioides 23]
MYERRHKSKQVDACGCFCVWPQWHVVCICVCGCDSNSVFLHSSALAFCISPCALRCDGRASLRPDDILASLLENEEHVTPRGLSRLPTSGRTGRRGTLRRRADFRLRLRGWLAKASSSASVSNFTKCLAP